MKKRQAALTVALPKLCLFVTNRYFRLKFGADEVRHIGGRLRGQRIMVHTMNRIGSGRQTKDLPLRIRMPLICDWSIQSVSLYGGAP